MQRIVFPHQPAVRVEQQPLLGPARRDAGQILGEERFHVGLRVAKSTVRAEEPVIAHADDVRPQIGEGIVRARAQAGKLPRFLVGLGQDHGRAETANPDIGAVGEPVVVGDQGKAAFAPRFAPRILDPEAPLVVADNGEGVAAQGLDGEGNDTVRADRAPAAMHRARGINNSDLRQGAVHGDDLLVVNSEISAKRTTGRVERPGVRQRAAWFVGVVGPDRGCADTVLVPALHRAAGAGAGISLARPFVITPGHLVEHARADRREVRDDAPPLQKKVGHGREAETGAGPLLPLVQHRHSFVFVIRLVLLERHARGHLDQRGHIHLVPEIERVGMGVELVLTDGDSSHDPGAGAANDGGR